MRDLTHTTKLTNEISWDVEKIREWVNGKANAKKKKKKLRSVFIMGHHL